jgi:hypothetical protein
MIIGPKQPITPYLIYVQKDEAFKKEFENYLTILQQTQHISGWVERLVQPGIDWSHVIDPRLLIADLILLLTSPDLLGSGYCSGAEVREVLNRHKLGNVRLIPIILRHVDLTGFPISVLQTLPGDDKELWKPIAAWSDRDEAWRKVDQSIRRVIANIVALSSNP